MKKISVILLLLTLLFQASFACPEMIRYLDEAMNGMQSQANRLDELVETNLHYVAATEDVNESWISLARRQDSAPRLYFDMENGALKRLNDQIGDKNIVTALTNRHKQIFMEELQALQARFPGIEVAPYSDFKSIRLAISGDIPANMQTELANAFTRATERFGNELSGMSDLEVLARENPAAWFHAGMGGTADQAGASARESRRLTNPRGGVNNPVGYNDDLIGLLRTVSRQVDEDRLSLARSFSRNSTLRAALLQQVDGVDGLVPNQEFFAIMRKFRNRSDHALIHFVMNKYGVRLNDGQVAMMKRYLDNVDRFSPGIWVGRRELATLDGAANGGFSVDFEGMGAANLEQVAKDLASGRNLEMDQLLSRIRAGEATVTEVFNQKKQRFMNVVAEVLGDDAATVCSGDDCVAVLQQALSPQNRHRMMQAIANADPPLGVRTSFIPAGVDAASRSELAVHGELIEKQLRKIVTGVGDTRVPVAKMQNVTIAIEMPGEIRRGPVQIHLGVREGTTLTPAEVRSIQEAVAESVREASHELQEASGIVAHYQAASNVIIH